MQAGLVWSAGCLLVLWFEYSHQQVYNEPHCQYYLSTGEERGRLQVRPIKPLTESMLSLVFCLMHK